MKNERKLSKKTGMNVLSLFDGVGCGRLALDRANVPVMNYFASEIDKHAIKVTMENWPNTIQLVDVIVRILKHINKGQK